jgi:HEAT repeat protein
MAPTLARVIRDSEAIALVEVARFSSDKGVVLLKKIRDLKGQLGADPIKHLVRQPNESAVDRPILEWAEPGRRGVLFVAGKAALVCMGQGWYQVQASDDGWWHLSLSRPDLPLAYFGSASRLCEAIPLMLAGKRAIITTLPHGGDQEGASFDLALNRASLPGLVKVQRLRADLQMPPMVMAVALNPNYVLGDGQAGADEITVLRAKLHADDATVRAESASDLGSLGTKAASAADDLAQRLEDASAGVRLAAGSALLRIQPGNARALDVLASGLTSADGSTRRHAARAVGLAGSAAAPLVRKLGALLADPDTGIRRTALQAAATLGPAAAGTLDRVLPLLNQPETAIDAADALGRIGAAARPALKQLARMLDAEAPAQRWAAVRAMSQIGGDDAAPAVNFMIRAMANASDVENYNMLIYLALLGPVARDAVPAVQQSRLKNPFLRQLTIWAIDPGDNLPWFGNGGKMDVAGWVLESYVIELGDHLKPAARQLARRIMDGNAGNVPAWGYKLLARFPEQSLAILKGGLEDRDLVQRERAAVALGFMGRGAAAARPQVAEALRHAADEREQRLLQWCLREMAEPAP